MPSDEIRAFDDARRAAYAEANAHNSRIAEIEKLRDVVVREPDDVNPYSFNLPTPPTSLASSDSHAAKITRTKVVGIMYNKVSPSAIINVDEKDYLVRMGDQIIGQEYKVLQINPSWITVGMGANIYSASIGELFSRDELDSAQNDVYNLRTRFGGRKG
jgi:Tfp pilus assembly protein PilP